MVENRVSASKCNNAITLNNRTEADKVNGRSSSVTGQMVKHFLKNEIVQKNVRTSAAVKMNEKLVRCRYIGNSNILYRDNR